MAAEAVDHAKAVLVGEIVAEEHRHAARQRPLLHESLDGAALVAAGRLELGHHLPALHFGPVADLPRRLAHHDPPGARQLRREARVQSQTVAHLLEHTAAWLRRT